MRDSICLLATLLLLGCEASGSAVAPPDSSDTVAPPDSGLVELPDSGGGDFDAGTPDAGEAIGDAGSCTDDTWQSYGQGFFRGTCHCHSQLTSYSGVQSYRSQVRAAISNRSMPRDTTLPPSEIQRVVHWLDCNLPQ